MIAPSGRTIAAALLWTFYAVMWFGGVFSYIFHGGPAPHEGWTAPAFLALAASIVLVSTDRGGAWWLALVLVLGFAVEYAGVRGRWIFGAYEYTGALSPRLLGVPIAISAAWMVLVAYTQQLRRAAGLAASRSAVAAAAWMTAIDLVLDPVAAGPLRYWTWLEPGLYYGVPARNFAGWFVVSLLMFTLLSRRAWQPNQPVRLVGLTIVLFFTIIAAAHGLAMPTAIGALLCGADLSIGAWRHGARRSRWLTGPTSHAEPG